MQTKYRIFYGINKVFYRARMITSAINSGIHSKYLEVGMTIYHGQQRSCI